MVVENRGHDFIQNEETRLKQLGRSTGMVSSYGPPPNILSLIAIPASSASITPVVIMRTAVCMEVRYTSRIQSTRERRSRISSAASSL